MSRDLLSSILDRLRERLSPRGMQLFHAVIVEERPVEEVAVELGMTVDAVYAWKTRFGRLARQLLVEAVPPSEPKPAHTRPVREAGQ